MFLFKTKAPTVMPGLDKIKEEGTKEVFKDTNKITQDVTRDLLDDLAVLERVERVSSLPTATIDNLGKFLIVNGTGSGADILYIGLDTGNNGYKFNQIAEENTWTNYTDSTITGFDTISTKLIFVKKTSNIVFVIANIIGVSNATTFRFTVPYTSAALMYNTSVWGYGLDSSTPLTSPADFTLPPGSTTVTLNKIFGTTENWTNSGNKGCYLQFFYRPT